MTAAALGGTMVAAGLHLRRTRERWPLQSLTVIARDGRPLPAFLRLPEGSGPHPAVLMLHGGRGGAPARAAVLARSPVAVGLLESGFAVLSLSYRRHALMAEEVDDAEAAFGLMTAHPLLDPRRLAILGNSHGGSIAIVTAPRTTARAVVEYCGVTDIEVMVRYLTVSRLRASTPLVREALDDLKRICGGTFDEVPEVYRALSPAYRIFDLSVPIMIAHGSHDGIVPVTHAYILRDALEAAEKPYEMHIYPRMPHPFPFQKRPQSADVIARTIDFLRRCLSEPTTGT